MHTSKPGWLPWYGAVFLGIQVLLAVIFIGAALADVVGLRVTPSSNLFGGWFDAIVIAWGLLAVVAAWGMWRNYWWAFFVEILILWSVFAFPYANIPTVSGTRAVDLSLRSILRVIALLYFSGILGVKGVREFKSLGKATVSDAG
jgi:hypothetical protein